MENKSPQLKIPASVHRELKIMAASNGDKLHILVTRILEQYLERERNVKNRIY
jgi:rRNA-processing protein FCF1